MSVPSCSQSCPTFNHSLLGAVFLGPRWKACLPHTYMHLAHTHKGVCVEGMCTHMLWFSVFPVPVVAFSTFFLIKLLLNLFYLFPLLEGEAGSMLGQCLCPCSHREIVHAVGTLKICLVNCRKGLLTLRELFWDTLVASLALSPDFSLSLFFFFWPRHVACEILVPQPEIKPVPPAVEARSPNHWTASEVPSFLSLLCICKALTDPDTYLSLSLSPS